MYQVAQSCHVVLDTTKVQIFKQITTLDEIHITRFTLFQIPQRYRFSSKSQLILKQTVFYPVVLDTTKVQIFKQITTDELRNVEDVELFQIPQRYRFSSKSQPPQKSSVFLFSCFRYHKGTDFQANHNKTLKQMSDCKVVLDTTKVQIFKQITTMTNIFLLACLLFQIPQRYRFSSKSQLIMTLLTLFPVVLDTTKVQIFKQITTVWASNGLVTCCFRYHKGTDFQANHNSKLKYKRNILVVLDTTKVQIFKQITTTRQHKVQTLKLFQIPQRYRFSSKSQL